MSGRRFAFFVDGELVNGEPVVVAGLLEVDEPDLVMDGAVAFLVGDGDAIGEEAVEAAVVFDQVFWLSLRMTWRRGFVEGVGGDVGVDAGEGAAEPLG